MAITLYDPENFDDEDSYITCGWSAFRRLLMLPILTKAIGAVSSVPRSSHVGSEKFLKK